MKLSVVDVTKFVRLDKSKGIDRELHTVNSHDAAGPPSCLLISPDCVAVDLAYGNHKVLTFVGTANQSRINMCGLALSFVKARPVIGY